jgi:hypothetical protein
MVAFTLTVSNKPQPVVVAAIVCVAVLKPSDSVLCSLDEWYTLNKQPRAVRPSICRDFHRRASFRRGNLCAGPRHLFFWPIARRIVEQDGRDQSRT